MTLLWYLKIITQHNIIYLVDSDLKFDSYLTSFRSSKYFYTSNFVVKKTSIHLKIRLITILYTASFIYTPAKYSRTLTSPSNRFLKWRRHKWYINSNRICLHVFPPANWFFCFFLICLAIYWRVRFIHLRLEAKVCESWHLILLGRDRRLIYLKIRINTLNF